MKINVYRSAAMNRDIVPNSPLMNGFHILPEIFLKRSDEYMSTLIEYLSKTKKYKRVFMLVGHGQSDSIANLLDYRSASHFEYELRNEKIKKSILKDLTCEDMVEKYAILDVMNYGKDIFEDIESRQICLIILTYIFIL